MKDESSDRIITIPNFMTLVRALGVPLFLYLYLSAHHSGWAFFVLWVGAITDYLDGKLARLLHQTSRLGALMDPAIDRLYIFSTLIAFMINGAWPVWLGIILIARDTFLGFVTLRLKKVGEEFIEVSYLGKAATFNLLYALPLFLLSGKTGPGLVAKDFGWAFAIWGSGLYLVTGYQYAAASMKKLHQKGSIL